MHVHHFPALGRSLPRLLVWLCLLSAGGVLAEGVRLQVVKLEGVSPDGRFAVFSISESDDRGGLPGSKLRLAALDDQVLFTGFGDDDRILESTRLLPYIAPEAGQPRHLAEDIQAAAENKATFWAMARKRGVEPVKGRAFEAATPGVFSHGKDQITQECTCTRPASCLLHHGERVFELRASAENRLLQATAVYATSESEAFVLETVETFSAGSGGCPPAWKELKSKPLPSFLRVTFKPRN
jgi:hypothetical protein